MNSYVRDDPRTTFEQEGLVHLDAVYRAALRLAGNATDADDLVQETMLKGYRAWHQYRPGSNAKAWLLTILRHTFIDEYRRRAARRETVALEAIPPLADPKGAFSDARVDEEVLRATAELPLPFREVFVLTDVEGMRYDETSKLLAVPVGTVKSRLFRARKMLQARLAQFASRTGWLKVR